MQDHSASDKSVWYALLMLGTLPGHWLRTPFRTVSEEDFSEVHIWDPANASGPLLCAKYFCAASGSIIGGRDAAPEVWAARGMGPPLLSILATSI